jgi:hypothetical protein
MRRRRGWGWRCARGRRYPPDPDACRRSGADPRSSILAGLLYFVAQPGPLDLTGDSGLRLVAIVVVVSTIAGLTVEAIFRKLLGIDVLQTRSIASGEQGSLR